MDSAEQDICNYLRTWPAEFLSAREIARRAGGKWRFREDPNWAQPILLQMAEKGILEKDENGHYGMSHESASDWIASKLQAIFPPNKSGTTYEADNPEPAGT